MQFFLFLLFFAPQRQSAFGYHSSDIRKGSVLFNRDQQGGIKTKEILRTIALSVL